MTVYQELISAGLSKELAIKGLIKHIVNEQPDLNLFPQYIIDEINNNIKKPRWQETSMTRVIGHTLLAAAYQAHADNDISGEALVTISDIKRFVGEIYNEKYKTALKWPAENTLSLLLSNFRNGKISGLPAIITRGPLYVTTKENKRVQAIYVSPRDFNNDVANKLLEDVPSWVWNPQERE